MIPGTYEELLRKFGEGQLLDESLYLRSPVKGIRALRLFTYNPPSATVGSDVNYVFAIFTEADSLDEAERIGRRFVKSTKAVRSLPSYLVDLRSWPVYVVDTSDRARLLDAEASKPRAKTAGPSTSERKDELVRRAVLLAQGGTARFVGTEAKGYELVASGSKAVRGFRISGSLDEIENKVAEVEERVRTQNPRREPASRTEVRLEYELRRLGVRLPKDAVPNFKKRLGSGSFGTVWRTRGGYAFKITTDIDEARFVRMSFDLGDPPVGVARYYGLVQVRDVVGNPLWLIWREPASSVGVARAARTDKHVIFMATYASFHVANKVRSWAQLKKWLSPTSSAMDQAIFAYHTESPDEFQGRSRSPAVSVAMLLYALERMEQNPRLAHVAEAWRFYLQHKVLLTDLHPDNLGSFRRTAATLRVPTKVRGKMITGILDPGQAQFYQRLAKDYVDVVMPPRSR